MALTATQIAPVAAIVAGILIVPFGDPNPRLQAKRRADEGGEGDDVRSSRKGDELERNSEASGDRSRFPIDPY